MKNTFWAFGLALAACGGANEAADTDGATSAVVEQKLEVPVTSEANGCRAGGQFDFAATGTGLAQANGTKVVVAAYANHSLFLTSEIQDGAFQVACPDSLYEETMYPTTMAYIDVNGDGRCSSGDVGTSRTFFAWMFDLNESFEASEWLDVDDGMLGGPIGSSDKGICTHFNEPPPAPMPVDESFALGCEGNGAFDFHAGGFDMTAYEGKRISVLAHQNASSVGIGKSPERHVELSTVIRGGAFDLFCKGAVDENYAYTAQLAYIDVNADGRCSEGDVGSMTQLYGWNDHVTMNFSGSGWFTSVAEGHGNYPPIGSNAADFCSVFEQ